MPSDIQPQTWPLCIRRANSDLRQVVARSIYAGWLIDNHFNPGPVAATRSERGSGMVRDTGRETVPENRNHPQRRKWTSQDLLLERVPDGVADEDREAVDH